MERDAEIERTRHELVILRARYGTYERWGRVLRTFFVIVIPLFAIVIGAMIVKLFIFDVLTGVFVVGLAALALALLVWLAGIRNLTHVPSQPAFWTYLASSPTSPWGLNPAVPSPPVRLRPDAQIIEEQIAEREKRLADLGVAP